MLAWLMAGADYHDVDFITGTPYTCSELIPHGGSLTQARFIFAVATFPQGWDMSNSGVVRWLMHIMPKAAAPVLQGAWEARAQRGTGYECTHAGDTWSPICLQDDSTALVQAPPLCYIPEVAQQCGG